MERSDEYRQISEELVVDIRRYLDLKRPQMQTAKGLLSFKKGALVTVKDRAFSVNLNRLDLLSKFLRK